MAKDKAKSQMSEANQKMPQATALYNQQENLNNLYKTATININHYKGKSDELTSKSLN
jgi:hypothetical protein